MGLATIVLTIIAGVMSFDYVNRRFPPKPAPVEQVTEQDAKAQTDPAAVKPPGVCVERDGSWRNWSWPNVPMLSPKCESAK
ncbi:hypothetical protein A4A58_22530 [Tardiphaga robiniae]|uniref:Uncharacterized protein n=2 Tax=Tardiphaga robiniae TaxID=943830 RepID=A0A164A598_9BRAD|nr:hypothetical protein A4A58_22530 [Tardiphaga robiniae]